MMNQSTKLILSLFLPGLLLCTSCSENKSSGELPAIQLATAYKSPTEIKASECFTSVQYLPLETTEDCLLDNASQIQFIDNYILITSSRQNKAFLFDKETGKFLRHCPKNKYLLFFLIFYLFSCTASGPTFFFFFFYYTRNFYQKTF